MESGKSAWSRGNISAKALRWRSARSKHEEEEEEEKRALHDDDKAEPNQEQLSHLEWHGRLVWSTWPHACV